MGIDVTRDVNRLGDILQGMESSYEHYAKQIGINSTMMYLLQIVYDNEPCTQKQICAIMMLPKQTVNTIVKDYQRKGLFEFAPSSEDKRNRYIRLTEKGREYCERILPPIAEAEIKGLKQFTEDEQNLLFSLLERYNQSFRESLLQKTPHINGETE